MKDFIEMIIAFFIGLAIITFIIAQPIGLIHGLSRNGECKQRIRGEFLVPTYILGCYLGEKVE